MNVTCTLLCRACLLLLPSLVFAKGQSWQGEDQGEVWHTGFIDETEAAFSFVSPFSWP